jgi:signal transduction histidine kinase
MRRGRHQESSASDASVQWREPLLHALLVTTSVLSTVAFPMIALQSITLQEPGWLVYLAGLYVLLVGATVARRMNYRLRVAALLAGVGMVALIGFVRVGYQVGPGVGCVLLVIISGLLLGRVALVTALLVSVGTILGVGAFQVQTQAASIAPHVFDPTRFSNWLRTAVVFTMFTGVLAAAVSFVVSHIERTLSERTEALANLRASRALHESTETALNDAQRTILQMQKMEAVGRLAGGVAHDFNNVLMLILGWADLLRNGEDDPAQLRAGLDEIASAATRAANLTRQLLIFGRRGPFVPRAVSASALLTEMQQMLSRVLPANINLTLTAEPDVAPFFADQDQMHQVLLNLCVNARDAMPNGGTLEICARNIEAHRTSKLPAGSWVALTVRDTGIGMDGATAARAFEPFFTTKGNMGTGLGLSSVYGIIAHCGGHVLVDSEVGKGSTFTLLLPPCLPAAAESSDAAVTAIDCHAHSTILVAEDETDVRSLIVTALREKGHTVLAADSGGAALEVARRYRGRIDLLCTDGVTSDVSSATLIADFHALFPDARVLVCSGHPESLHNLPGTNDIAFLKKPFASADLHRAVAKVLAA